MAGNSEETARPDLLEGVETLQRLLIIDPFEKEARTLGHAARDLRADFRHTAKHLDDDSGDLRLVQAVSQNSPQVAPCPGPEAHPQQWGDHPTAEKAEDRVGNLRQGPDYTGRRSSVDPALTVPQSTLAPPEDPIWALDHAAARSAESFRR